MPPSLFVYLVFLSLLFIIRAQPFCSASCTQGWNGTTFTSECIDATPQGCTACDQTFSSLNSGQCIVNQSKYHLEATLLDPSGPLLTGWIQTNSTGIGSTSLAVGTDTYDIITLNGSVALTYQLPLANPHSSLRFRIFTWIQHPATAPAMNLTIMVDGINNTHVMDTTFIRYLSSSPGSYIYTTPQMPHNNIATTVTIFLATTAVPGSFNIGLKQLMVFSKPCPANCLGCYHEKQEIYCSSCDGSYYMYRRHCIRTCPNGTLPSGSMGCLPCDSSCGTCNGATSQNCTSCIQNSSYIRYLYNRSCMTQCPDKTYAVYGSFICLPCAPGCYSCSGKQPEDCTSCTADQNGTFYYLSTSGTGCHTECPAGQLKPNVCGGFNCKCLRCASLCASCQTTPQNCLSCVNNSTVQSYFFSYNNSCLATCPPDHKSVNGTCVCADPQKYSSRSTGTCDPCDKACNTCFADGSTSCYSCSNGYYLLSNSTTCSSSCPTGQFASTITNQCYLCSRACLACSGTSTNCTICDNSSYLFNFTCILVCPKGYGVSNISRSCIQCINGTVSYNNSCVSKCPFDYKADNSSNSCIQSIQEDKELLDFKILPAIINKGSQLCLNLLFKTKLQLILNIDYELEIFVSPLITSRLLQTASEQLNITNVDVDQSLLSVKVYTNVPEAIKNPNSNQIVVTFINNSLQAQNGTLMNQYNALPLNDPHFTRQIYTNFYSTELEWIGTVLSIIGILLLPLAYFKKFTYYPVLQFLMKLQLMRLLSFTLFPVNYQTFAFLKGFDVAQFQWMPNVVDKLTPIAYTQNAFLAYQFKSSTMNFLSLAASNLLFMLVFQPVLVYLYFYNKQKFLKFILWFEKTLIYICSINILFAAVSSFISLFINTQSISLFFIASQLLGLITIGGLIYFFIVQRNGFRKYKMFLCTSLAFCLLIPFFSKSFPVSLVLLNFAQVAILVTSYKNRKKSDKRTKPLFVGRCLFLVMVDFVELGYYPALVITIGTLFFAAQLGILGYIIYMAFSKKVKPQKIHRPRVTEVKGMIKQEPVEKEVSQTVEKVVKFSDDRVPGALIFYEQERSQKSPRKKAESPLRTNLRKDSQTYYSPRKNWRNYNKEKSRTIYKEESLVENNSGELQGFSNPSGMQLQIKPLDNVNEWQ